MFLRFEWCYLDQNLGESVKNDLDIHDQFFIETSYKTLMVHLYLEREVSYYISVKENAPRDGNCKTSTSEYLIQQGDSNFITFSHHNILIWWCILVLRFFSVALLMDWKNLALLVVTIEIPKKI